MILLKQFTLHFKKNSHKCISDICDIVAELHKFLNARIPAVPGASTKFLHKSPTTQPLLNEHLPKKI